MFIFYGEELVEQITSEAAKQLGYTSSWFNSDERNLRWDGNNLYRTAFNNAQGDIVQIDPDYVNNFNSSRFFAPLLIFFFLMFVYYVVDYNLKNKRNKKTKPKDSL